MFKKLLCVTLLCASVGVAHAGGEGFYIGGGVGQAHYDDSLPGQISDAYRDYDEYAFVSANLRDDKDQAWKLFGGYRFAPWFGVELGWVDLGEARSNFVLDSLLPGSDARADIDGFYDVSGATATVFGELDFSDSLSGIARVGVFHAESDYSEGGVDANDEPHSYRHSQSDLETTAGLGLNLRMSARWDLRLDWDRYFDVGERFALNEDGNGSFDVDLVALSVAYRFGE